jgi:hypothetical protein
MKRILSLFFVLCLVLNCSAYDAFSGLKRHQHDAMHWIVMVTPDQKAGCTANVIGPHALLTAQHCDLAGATVRLDGSKEDHQIVEKEYDGHDHMILIVDGVYFDDKIDYHPHQVTQGQQVYFWGNPQGIHDQYREGIATGMVAFDGDELVHDGTPVQLFMMDTQPGDSGSAIFNTDGDLVGIVTYGVFDGMFAGSYSLNFSKQQIQRARVK